MKLVYIFSIIAYFLPYVSYSQQHTRSKSAPFRLDDTFMRAYRDCSSPIDPTVQGSQDITGPSSRADSPSYEALEALFNTTINASKRFVLLQENLRRLRSLHENLPGGGVLQAQTEPVSPRERIPKFRAFTKTLPIIITAGLSQTFLDTDMKLKFDPFSIIISAAAIKYGTLIIGSFGVFWVLKHELSDLFFGRYKEREERLRFENETFKREVNEQLAKYRTEIEAWVRESEALLRATAEATREQIEALDQALKESRKLKSQDSLMQAKLQNLQVKVSEVYNMMKTIQEKDSKPTIAQRLGISSRSHSRANSVVGSVLRLSTPSPQSAVIAHAEHQLQSPPPSGGQTRPAGLRSIRPSYGDSKTPELIGELSGDPVG